MWFESHEEPTGRDFKDNGPMGLESVTLGLENQQSEKFVLANGKGKAWIFFGFLFIYLINIKLFDETPRNLTSKLTLQILITKHKQLKLGKNFL